MPQPLLPHPSRRSYLLLLAAIALAALLLRVIPLHDRVIRDDVVRFQGIDAQYHIRLKKYVVRNYPHRLIHDPLRLFPAGQSVDVYPAYDFVNATAALVVGFGSPSDRTVGGMRKS